MPNFRRWMDCNHVAIDATRHLNSMHITSFQQWRFDVDKAAKRTADKDVANLHSVFRWAVGQRMLRSSPADYSRAGTVKLFGDPGSNNDTYTTEEVVSLVKAAEATGDDQIRDMIVVLANTGMRFEEMAHLDASCLDLKSETGFVIVKQRAVMVRGKRVFFRPKDSREEK